jgi:hypothetical protein
MPGAMAGHLMEASGIYFLGLEAAGVGQACHIEHVVADPHPSAGRCITRSAAECPKWQVLYRKVAAFVHWQHTRTGEVDHADHGLVHRSINDRCGVCHEALLTNYYQLATLCNIERNCSLGCCMMLASNVCSELYAEMLQSDAENADVIRAGTCTCAGTRPCSPIAVSLQRCI